MSLGTHPSTGFRLWPCTYPEPLYKMFKCLNGSYGQLILYVSGFWWKWEMGGRHTAENPRLSQLLEIFPAILKTLLLLLSCFSRVRLCVAPETAAHQGPSSLGFSRQEHWSGLPFPSPMCESEKWKWSRSVVSDSSRPHGLQSSVHGIFQARVLEWVAIARSAWRH